MTSHRGLFPLRAAPRHFKRSIPKTTPGSSLCGCAPFPFLPWKGFLPQQIPGILKTMPNLKRVLEAARRSPSNADGTLILSLPLFHSSRPITAPCAASPSSQSLLPPYGFDVLTATLNHAGPKRFWMDQTPRNQLPTPLRVLWGEAATRRTDNDWPRC